jgi:murein DD-endopeptidase MepM/ murein hydrolase activator NlpD
MLKRRDIFLLVLLAAGCDQVSRLRQAFLQPSPYDAYATSMREAGLQRTPLGAEWLAAGERALAEPHAVTLPHRGNQTIRGDKPSAVAFRLELRRGRVYNLELRSSNRLNAFADLFHIRGEGTLARVAAIGPPERWLEFEPREDGAFIIRIQAELLGEGVAIVAQRQRHALLFPVRGRGRGNIQSFFGAARGARGHQGIDIFAPRGTPVVAATDGWISSTDPNELGGNVVWLWDERRGQSLYYAHLDRHAVRRGDRVAKGDVLGFVGNTGNARTTAPHLHFGIYRRGLGAIDPLYYVVDPAS